MSFSERLKIIVEEDYKTQVNFAEAIGVTKVSVNDYLNWKRKPNFEALRRIGDLGYDLNWLINGENLAISVASQSIKISINDGRKMRNYKLIEEL